MMIFKTIAEEDIPQTTEIVPGMCKLLMIQFIIAWYTKLTKDKTSGKIR